MQDGPVRGLCYGLLFEAVIALLVWMMVMEL